MNYERRNEEANFITFNTKITELTYFLIKNVASYLLQVHPKILDPYSTWKNKSTNNPDSSGVSWNKKKQLR